MLSKVDGLSEQVTFVEFNLRGFSQLSLYDALQGLSRNCLFNVKEWPMGEMADIVRHHEC